MRTPSVLLLVSAACAVLVCQKTHAQAASASTDQRLAVLRQSFEAAVSCEAGKSRDDAMATLNKSYIGAVERSLTAASKAGDLDLAVGLKAEITRVQTGGKVPATEAKKVQEALKSLRESYRGALERVDADYAKRLQPILDRYDQALGGLQTELTRASLLEDATRIKGLREQVAKARLSGDLSLLAEAAASITSAADLAEFLSGTVWTWEIPNSNGAPGTLTFAESTCQIGIKTPHPWKAQDNKSVLWADDGTTMKFNSDYTTFQALCPSGPRSGKRLK